MRVSRHVLESTIGTIVIGGAVLALLAPLARPKRRELVKWTVYADTVAVALFDDGAVGCSVRPDPHFHLRPWPAVCDTAEAHLKEAMTR